MISTYSPHFFFFFFNDTATTEIYTLSLHDALPIFGRRGGGVLLEHDARFHHSPWYGSGTPMTATSRTAGSVRSEEHTSELQSRSDLVCRLLLEKKKKQQSHHHLRSPPAASQTVRSP